MGILDQYKKAIAEEGLTENNDFPSDSNLTENDKEAYEAVLKKMRKGDYSNEEIQEAIDHSRKNMNDFNEEHHGGMTEDAFKHNMIRITNDELIDSNLLSEKPITEIRVIRAYCPNCGKELVSKTPPMYNPFTMQKVCLHDCSCGKKYNLDNSYPHIAFYEDGAEIETFV